MKIIAHRGFWYPSRDGNSSFAFERALTGGFGIETDYRDFSGVLSISHDPADSSAMKASVFFERFSRAVPLAINIKADGLAPLLKSIIEKHSILDYFVFDMSIPETLRYFREGLNVFMRMSEYEPDPPMLDKARGIWLDYFDSDGWRDSIVQRLLDDGKRICVLSPEIHGRDPRACWDRMMSLSPSDSGDLLICTDRPEEFRRYSND